jgi:transposase-like protein
MKIRKFIHNNLEMEEKLKDFVEGDEGWFGKRKNNNQEIIMGLVERSRRKLRLFVIDDLKESTLYPIILKNVEKGSSFYTDQRITYSITGIHYHHQTTNHSKGEFARTGNVHSNTMSL